MHSAVLLLPVALLLASAPLASTQGCAPGGPATNKLRVHVAPHTHDDVGWDESYLECGENPCVNCGLAPQPSTHPLLLPLPPRRPLPPPLLADYYGNGPIGGRNVSQIITNVVRGLAADPKRRFSYVEQAFFQIWFETQADDVKATVRTLVANRQLVFLNGGFSMHDEAAPTYVDMLDNTAVGQRNIVNNFNVSALPTIGWQWVPSRAARKNFPQTHLPFPARPAAPSRVRQTRAGLTRSATRRFRASSPARRAATSA